MNSSATITLVLLALVSGISPAATLAVGSGGSIQAALDAAQNGDTIEVGPGIYNERIDFGGKEVVLRSLAGAGGTVLGQIPVFRRHRQTIQRRRDRLRRRRGEQVSRRFQRR